ncbi:signal peptidase I [Bradymonas sediminis]|uniref:Signal peptidase I n=2 Tax=Bradymonas sediminis TaxID=1548548 RepID=A0A2Z4FR07_9DELT|nr:signal peptidase I [Bradymonas sediminis]
MIGMIVGLVFSLFALLLVVVMIAGLWKIFEKAGHPGWAAIVPIYNVFIMLQIVGRPTWWLVLFFIPMINGLIGIVLNIELAKAFGKDLVYGLGMVFLPFIFAPMLGFGDAQYQGPDPLF